MEQYAARWVAKNNYVAEKQYILIRQCDKTWNENGAKESLREMFMIQNLQMGKDKRKIENVLFMSAEINALNQALNDGSKMKDLSFAPLLLIAPEGYVVKSY